MTHTIPTGCPQCNGHNLERTGERTVECQDCGAVGELVRFDLGHPDDDRVDASPLAMKLASYGALTEAIKAGKVSFPSPSMLAELSRYPGPRRRSGSAIPHIVDREGCNEKDGSDKAAGVLAHEIYDAYNWIEWVSVSRQGHRFNVKVRESYPVNIEGHLLRWLHCHRFAVEAGAHFDLTFDDDYNRQDPTPEELFAKLAKLAKRRAKR